MFQASVMSAVGIGVVHGRLLLLVDHPLDRPGPVFCRQIFGGRGLRRGFLRETDAAGASHQDGGP